MSVKRRSLCPKEGLKINSEFITSFKTRMYEKSISSESYLVRTYELFLHQVGIFPHSGGYHVQTQFSYVQKIVSPIARSLRSGTAPPAARRPRSRFWAGVREFGQQLGVGVRVTGRGGRDLRWGFRGWWLKLFGASSWKRRGGGGGDVLRRLSVLQVCALRCVGSRLGGMRRYAAHSVHPRPEPAEPPPGAAPGPKDLAFAFYDP